MRTVDLRTAEPGYACSRVMCITITHEPSASIDVGERGVQEMLDNNSLLMESRRRYRLESGRACILRGAKRPSRV